MPARATAILLAVLGTTAPVAPALGGAAEDTLTIPKVPEAAELYSRNCQGCHGHEGVSVPEVPTLRGRVGWFLHIPAGRDYLVRVPGVAFAHVDDAGLAQILNWMLLAYSAEQLPQGWRPFTADEVGRLRRDPVASVHAERSGIVEELVAAGVIPGAEAVGFGAEPTY